MTVVVSWFSKWRPWLPHGLAIGFIFFISLFALDIFDAGYTWYQVIIGLVMHLIPTFILILLLWFSWRQGLIGGLIWLSLGVWYLWQTLTANGPTFWPLALPVFLIGWLFIFNSHQVKKLAPSKRALVLVGSLLLVLLALAPAIWWRLNEPPRPFGHLVSVKIYFNNTQLDPQISCSKVFAVERQLSDISADITTSALARLTLEQLLLGPNKAEAEQGYFTSLPAKVVVKQLDIGQGLAKIDFGPSLEQGVGGSCRVSAIRSQITQTLSQFPGVSQVIISVEGRVEDALQP